MKTTTEIGSAVLARLLAQAAARRAIGNLLRADVRAVLAQFPGPLTAKQVLKHLNRAPPPSLRRVQEVLAEIRAESSVPR
jgi:hypothetical protein